MSRLVRLIGCSCLLLDVLFVKLSLSTSYVACNGPDPCWFTRMNSSHNSLCDRSIFLYVCFFNRLVTVIVAVEFTTMSVCVYPNLGVSRVISHLVSVCVGESIGRTQVRGGVPETRASRAAATRRVLALHLIMCMCSTCRASGHGLLCKCTSISVIKTCMLLLLRFHGTDDLGIRELSPFSVSENDQ